MVSASSPRTCTPGGFATWKSSSGSVPTSAPTVITRWFAVSPRLSGAPVRAPDIRAGAALVVAGLAAEGETVVSGVHHVDRGYDDLVGRLVGIGADIARV